MTQDELKASIDKLSRLEERHLLTHQWWYALLHGLLVGIGGTVGVALVLTVILWVLNKLSGLPGADSARYLLENAIQR